MKSLLGTKDVAKILGVGRHKIPDYIREGLAVVRLPGAKRMKFRPEDVEAFVEKLKNVGPEDGPIELTEAVQTPTNQARLQKGLKQVDHAKHAWRSHFRG